MKNEKTKVELNEKLQSLLDNIGSNPIEENEIYDSLNSCNSRLSIPVKIAMKRSDLNINDFSAEDISEFAKAMQYKIVSYKNEDGTYKITDSTKECDLPNFEEAEDISFITNDIFEAMNKGDDDLLEKHHEKMKSVCESVSKIDFGKLIEWEQFLIIDQLREYSTRSVTTALGIDIKN